MASITRRAFAKINLSLRVSRARPDGFHDVRTILQAITLFDRVTVRTRRGPFEIRCDMPGVPVDRTNLVWKAAQVLWRAAGRAGEPRDTLVTLEKTIPMQAGLGGGSSDAAAALLGLMKLWKVRLPDEEIHSAAATLGSDVPFFLVGGTVLGAGRGEELYPLENLPRYWVVLAIPPFGVPTRDAYRWFDEAQAGPDVPALHLFPNVPLVNDLEAPVVQRHAQIGLLKQRFTSQGALMAGMSGSGSSVFGVFTSARAANAAARALEAGGTRILSARFLPRQARRSPQRRRA